ncbi:helix-hairpin-helix domain-containing protein [Leptotrichia alba]|uniref:Helix-hairpin-helix domain-containing protein n=1 Tax=Leptotrichia alba TaxID=3239304 RepID=A0AB39V5Z0_9FUSO
MKIKYVIIFVMLLIAGNFLRLLIEDKNIPEIEISKEKNYKKDKAKKETDLTKSNVKFDINNIEYKDLLKLGINKNKAEKFVKYRDEVGIIKNIDEVKNVSGFGKTGLEIAQKFLFVDTEKIKNSKENYGREIVKYNINKLNDKELKKIGFSNKEIKKLLPEIEKNNIRSNVDLEKIIGKERYTEIEDKIKFIE